jgi:hypothetical protein
MSIWILATMIEVIYRNPFLLLHLNDLFRIDRYRYDPEYCLYAYQSTLEMAHGL